MCTHCENIGQWSAAGRRQISQTEGLDELLIIGHSVYLHRMSI